MCKILTLNRFRNIPEKQHAHSHTSQTTASPLLGAPEKMGGKKLFFEKTRAPTLRDKKKVWNYSRTAKNTAWNYSKAGPHPHSDSSTKGEVCMPFHSSSHAVNDATVSPHPKSAHTAI